MRNSFNTAGFSEVVHEIRHDPAEAAYVYTARAKWSPRRGLSAWIAPALLGTVKSARSFRFEVDDSAGDDPCGGASPMDFALTGIGSCALTTLVGGGSARGVEFDGVEMLIDYDHPAEPVRCRIDMDGSADDQVLAELVEQMRNFSPNCTTLTHPVAVELVRASGPAGQPTDARDTPEAPAAPDAPEAVAAGPAASCRVRWVSSTQLEAKAVGSDGPALRVDAPKQLTGVDWGPNPQEYLLMGLAADVAAHLGRLSAGLTGERHVWEVSAQAREDVRGLLQSDADAVVPLQDVICTVFPPAKLASEHGVGEVVVNAFAASAVRDLISRPHIADISLVTGGR
ncbi:OsmC family protein [Streptomyces sp. NPDC044780]|uniref:OsmC family protein n=1 Tax=unclassified Streptomyces TaxID=2593676 RepID=UPI0034103E98